MACSNNNCSGACNSCGFGTLNCIAGPLTNCGCCTGSAQYYQNYPFYTGPCGTVNCYGCGCGSSSRYRSGVQWPQNWNGWNSCCCSATVSECASKLSSTSAHFTASAPLMLSSGDAVDLVPSVNNVDCYSCTGNGILIRRPGTYMAIYTVHVPALQSVSTRMFLTLNGDLLEESSQDVATVNDGTTNGSSAHLIFHALPNSLLRLVSSDDISLTGCEAANVFKLTLIKL